MVVNAAGEMVEDWTQWDKMLRRPHAVYISPYDAEKHVWVVDDYRHAVFKFSNDGKKIVQTLGEPNVPGTDDKHFYRPTFMAWLPDGTFFVADGYTNTRVVKFDKDGKFLMTWGQKGERGARKRAGLLQQRARRRGRPADTPRFRERPGKRPRPGLRRQRQVSERVEVRPRPPSDIHLFIISGDRYLWAFDRGTSKMLKYISTASSYTPGARGATSQAVSGVSMAWPPTRRATSTRLPWIPGGAQKFRPRPGANPAFLIGKPVYSAWTD